MPEHGELVAPSEDMRKRLSALFRGMMKSLFKEKGAEFRVELVADPAVQEFVGAHAAVLDSSFEKVSMTDAMRRRLTRSNYIFSGMKAFHELNEAFPSLLDENGNRKPFERFLNDVHKIDETYNVNYLRAEYNFVSASAEMAARWERFMRDGDRYNLQYRTQRDDKVRPEHAALDRVTLPPSDPFWEEFYPPNGWNCFVAGTPVLTDRGWVPVDTISSGMTVVGGSGQYRTVIGTHAKTVNEELVRVVAKGSGATCTKDHHFLTQKGWISAGCLEPGDILVKVREVSPLDIFVNAVHNAAALFKYCLVSLKRKGKAVAALAIDDYPKLGDEEIHSVSAAEVARLDLEPHGEEVLQHQRFRSAQAVPQGAHPFGMPPSGGEAVLYGLSHGFLPEKRGGCLKFFRDAAQKVAVGFRLALAHMLSFKGKRVVDGGESRSRRGSSGRVVYPLGGYGLAAMTDPDAVLPEYAPDGSPVDSPVCGEPSETAFLHKVPLFSGLPCIHALNGFNSFFDFLRHTFLHTRYNIVEAKITLKKSESKVYDLSVDTDESYVIPLGIVHNCRCTVVQVRKSKYPVTNHDEAMRLGDEALQRDTKGMFRFNAGKEGKSVPDYNPYTIRKCITCPVAKGGKDGKLVAFMPDNEVCRACVLIRNSQKCVNQDLYDRLKSNPDYRDVAIDENSGGVKGIHKGHIIHSSKKERTFFSEKLTSTDLELLCQDILFRKGHSCILENETQLDASGLQLPQLDTLTNGEFIDIRAITEKGLNTVRNALNSKKKQLRNFNTKTGADCHSVILYFHDPSMFDEDQIKSQLGHTLKTVICVFKDGTIRKYTK